MSSIVKRFTESFVNAFNKAQLDSDAEAYCSSMRALVSNKGKTNLLHVAVHKILMDVPSYKSKFNDYATALNNPTTAQADVEELEKSLGRQALQTFYHKI